MPRWIVEIDTDLTETHKHLIPATTEEEAREIADSTDLERYPVIETLRDYRCSSIERVILHREDPVFQEEIDRIYELCDWMMKKKYFIELNNILTQELEKIHDVRTDIMLSWIVTGKRDLPCEE